MSGAPSLDPVPARGVITEPDPANAAAQAVNSVGPRFGSVVLAPLDSAGLVARGVYAAGTTYAIGDVVAGGPADLHIYRSLVNSNTGNTPASSPARWVLLADDVPRIGAIYKAVNGRWPIHFIGGSGVWAIASNLVDSTLGAAGIPDDTTIILDSGYQHVCALVANSNLRAIPFFAGAVFASGGGPGSSEALLFETVNPGEAYISTTASIAVGTDVLVGADPAQGALWTLAGHVHTITSTAAQIAKTGDTNSKITALVLTGLTTSNTDAGVLYASLSIPGGNATIQIWKDAGRTQLVAHGALAGNGGGAITLSADGASGVGGNCTVGATVAADTTPVFTCAIAAAHATLTMGAYLLGLDRECTYAYPATYMVCAITSYPKRIRIIGNQARFHGIADKYVCFSFSLDCSCAGCIAYADTTVHSYCFACDHGSRNTHFERCFVETTVPTSNTCTGFMLEGSESPTCFKCGVKNGNGVYDFGMFAAAAAAAAGCCLVGILITIKSNGTGYRCRRQLFASLKGIFRLGQQEQGQQE